MEKVQVVRLDRKDMSQAASVLGLAFADNPNTLTMVGGDKAKARRLMEAVAAVMLGRRYSRVLVAIKDGQVVGVLNAAEWPHCQLSLGEKLKTMPSMLRFLGRSVPKAMSVMSSMSKHDPRKPHLHLGPIGVLPDLQGKGIGSKMLEMCLGEVDRQAIPAYLEADVDKNVSLYERFGFVVIAEELIFGVRNRFMWREPRSAARLS